MTGRRARRPGETVFTVVLLLVSLYLLWSAYGIAGFESLSSPGAIPLATTAAMVVTAALVLLKTAQTPANREETLKHDILPPMIAIFAGLLIGYALLLEPLGFLPTSFLFLTVAIRLLSKRSIIHAALIALFSLILVYVLFRIVFTVLVPPGIVPEGEILAWIRHLVSGKA
ncbi:tripartite tricarboxylate transporter TctB family protein [Jiella sp. MQZ9-1]|uniref:Tripartite tricarboxylate transporter TctB family protein n=1 Tax=Jiella flava TaxID=2816857 RepID=A0A939G134_9HYPH|nr:tripartite tricarboxylate transporter TctB family protein [Jiella flava]MBO0663104.1 tripartite tricarboxylate transporter TctB family protein [Jiella flava]MCD2471523.1 tripartite tricarboxylate transporter TctB family protein [Jiella flava]